MSAQARGPVVRLVRLYIRPEVVPDFDAWFALHEEAIARSPGCQSLRLLTDCAPSPNGVVRVTWSVWESPAHLDAYRKSALFGVVWPRTKTFFAAEPEVGTYAELTPGNA